MDLKHLTDASLLSRLAMLVSQERGGTADLIEHLAEVDRREIVIDAGYPSLFDYCVKVLRYSEAAAFLRIRAARAAAKHPRVLADLRSGAIHLDAVMRLYPYLSDQNSDELLNRASGASKREILALVSTLGGGGPAPERDVIRRLPAPPPPRIHEVPPLPAELSPAPANAAVNHSADLAPEAPLAARPPEAHSAEEPPMPIPPGTRCAASPPVAILAPSRIRLGFTADDEFLRLLERLRALRRHKFPEGRLEDLLKEAIEAHLRLLDPALKLNRRPGKKTMLRLSARTGRRVTAAVKAEVWARDEARCAYAAPNGRRCNSRDFLEYDHVVPWALGGLSVPNNIRLLCRAHNQRLAKRRFGPRRVHVRPDAPESVRDPVSGSSEPGLTDRTI